MKENIIYFIEIIATIVLVAIGFIFYEGKHKKGFLKFLSVIMLIFVITIGTTFVFKNQKKNVEEIIIGENSAQEETPIMEIGEIVIEVNSTEKIKKPKTTYRSKDVTENVRIIGNVDNKKIGEYKIRFELDTLEGVYSKETVVKVADTKPPEIILNGDENYKLSYTKKYEEPGYKAIDAYEGDLTANIKTSKLEIDEKRTDIKYEVADSFGNKAEKVRTIEFIDDVPPVITLNGSDTTVYLNDEYEEKGANAKDEIEGDLTEKITISGRVDTSKEGTYIITYKVTDFSGNESKKERRVVVEKQSMLSLQTQAQNGSDGSKKGVIYLTFNDGPSNNITPKILDILNEKKVGATFFVRNYDTQGEKIVKREYQEGHTVAIHGYSNEYNKIYTSEEAYMENITKLQEKIKTSTGYNSIITRFPGGSSNEVSNFNPGIMTKLTKLVLERGYRYFDWNVTSKDEENGTTSKDIYNNVVSELSKSKQNVVLMHDIDSNTKLLDALGKIIDYGLENGYTFSKITETTPLVTQKVNN